MYKDFVYFVIFVMKKIIGLAVGCFVFLCSFWEAIYLTQETCNQQINHQCNSARTLKTCVVDWSNIYLWWINTNNQWSTWQASFCEWTVYWKTWILPWIWNGCYGNKKCCIWSLYNNNKRCCDPWKVVIGNQCKACQSLTQEEINNNPWVHTTCDDHGCDTGQQYPLGNWLIGCCAWVVENWECKLWAAGIWMRLNPQCLVNWQCGMNVYTMLGIRQSNENPTVMWLIQDVILAATTFVWTLIVFALVISWLVFAFWSVSWKDTKRAKTIIIDCFVWLLCVMGSYVIVRLIQFVATAWS